jgi:hypothetical protein
MAHILIDAPSAHVRIALRAYFTLLLLLLGFLGDRCCAMRVKLRLYRHQLVSIPQMTGWLSGTHAAAALVSLRASPAGWLGAIMLVASILGIICDLAVSGLVVTTNIVSRCPFNTTGMYTTLSDAHFNLLVGPDSAGTLFNIITQGQATSRLNGGVDGIFKKVNTDINFRPDSRDIVGRWVCNATGEENSFPADTNATDIVQLMLERGLLFNQSWTYSYELHGQSGTNALFIWTASQDDYPTQPWQVRAAVDMTSNPQAEKVMKVYSCSMDAPSLDWLLSLIRAQIAITGWVDIVKGTLYAVNVANAPGLPPDPGLVIASNLNTITMIAGASWNNTASPRVIDDPTQGCLASRALVSGPVMLLFAIITVGTVAMGLYLIALVGLIHLARTNSSTAYIKAVEDRTPGGLFGWMRRATYETDIAARGVDDADSWAKQWCFGPVLGLEGTGLVRLARNDQQSELLTVQPNIKRKPVPSGVTATIGEFEEEPRLGT